MDINKLRIDTDMVLVDYSTEAGDFRIKTEDEPSADLKKAVAYLRDIFTGRMQLGTVEDRIFVNGFESGKDDVGRWYRITGIYTANMVGHKLTTPKIRESSDPDFWKDKDPEEWPGFLDASEAGDMQAAVAEAEEFVKGKRSQLPLEGRSDLFGEES